MFMSGKEGNDFQSWQFGFEQLGGVKSGEVDFKPLTILCGPNNTGKTWVMYALYGFIEKLSGNLKLPEVKKIISSLYEDGSAELDLEEWIRKHFAEILRKINKQASSRLSSVFNSGQGVFDGAKFTWNISETELIDSAYNQQIAYSLVLGKHNHQILKARKEAGETVINFTLLDSEFPNLEDVISGVLVTVVLGKLQGNNTFLMPAERNGLHLFFNELSNRRTALLHHASKSDFDLSLLLKDVLGSRYAEPIADYIDWLNDLPRLKKNGKGEYHELAENLKKLVGGRYDVNAEGDIYFTPRKKRNAVAPPKMGLHLTSSTVKSLFGLWFYLEYQAQKNDVIMIDEPELNLHPSNQRMVARIIATLVNSGIRVIISTHSDYLVREINSLIMLSAEHPAKKKLMSKYGYKDCEILDPSKVSAILSDVDGLQEMDITPTEGINAVTFDAEINLLNDSSDDIFYTLSEEEMGDSEEL